jgi:hypothetical protein
MLKSSSRNCADRTSQRSLMKTIAGSRRAKSFLNILFPILVGVAIGTLATFILKVVGGKLDF